jgi:hypothetical protein
MKLFEAFDGYIFSFGFDMVQRKPDPHRICWCDPNDRSWSPRPTNLAGSIFCELLTFQPEFVRQVSGCVVAYQPGLCFELYNVGPPDVWRLHPLRAED